MPPLEEGGALRPIVDLLVEQESPEVTTIRPSKVTQGGGEIEVASEVRGSLALISFQEFRNESSTEQLPNSDENKIDTTQELDDDEGIIVEMAKKNRLRKTDKTSAAVSYKERLKQRLAKEKAQVINKKSSQVTSQRRSFSLEDDENLTFKSGSRVRLPRARSFRPRSSETVMLEFEEEKIDRSSVRGRSRSSRGRSSQEEESSRSSFGRSHSNSFRNKIRDSIREQVSDKDSPRLSPTKSSRSRFTPGATLDPTPVSTFVQQFSTATFKSGTTDKPKIVFKKFNRFDRPDRRALLRSKLFGNRPSRKPFRPKSSSTETPSEVKNDQAPEESSFPDDITSSPSALVIRTSNEDINQV